MSAPSEAVSPAERWAFVGGCRIWYREGGVGQPLVHLHGAGGPSWDEAHRIFATRFRVIAPALPGFGETTCDSRLDSLPALAGVIAGFIRDVAGGKAHVLGSSFGGGVATWLALQEPDVLDRLVLESPASDTALRARLGEIRTPTLALFGTEDRQIPAEIGRLYKERIPDCQFALVYQAGHIIRRDRPEAFARLVADFLDRGPAFLVNRG